MPLQTECDQNHSGRSKSSQFRGRAYSRRTAVLGNNSQAGGALVMQVTTCRTQLMRTHCAVMRTVALQAAKLRFDVIPTETLMYELVFYPTARTTRVHLEQFYSEILNPNRCRLAQNENILSKCSKRHNTQDTGRLLDTTWYRMGCIKELCTRDRNLVYRFPSLSFSGVPVRYPTDLPSISELSALTRRSNFCYFPRKSQRCGIQQM